MNEFRGNRQVAAMLGLVLLAVPTFAVLFPGVIHRMDRPVRIAVMVVWLVVAVLVAVAAQPLDEGPWEGAGRGAPPTDGPAGPRDQLRRRP